MKIEMIESTMFCPYCNEWAKVETITFGIGYIACGCSVCHLTKDYKFKEE